MIKYVSLLLSVLLSFSLVAGSVQVLDPKVSFQAVHRIGEHIVASGTNAGIYQSSNNGENWSKIKGPNDSQTLQFRDIQLLPSGALIVMSAGEGDNSRVYRTDDGENWQQQIIGTQPSTFYDCLHFVDDQLGWLYGDSDQQGLFILSTVDGGNNWHRQKLALKAQAAEGGFASSGTCLNQGQNNAIYIGTGNGQVPRVLSKHGQDWQSLTTPFKGGEAAGVFSVQQSGDWLYVFGGSLKTPQNPAVAQRYHLTTQQWDDLAEVPLLGAIYGSALLFNDNQTKVLIANPQGVSIWQPHTKTWTKLSENNIWSLACDDNLGCVGVGKDGVIERFTF